MVILALAFASIILVGCTLAGAYDRAAQRWGWPR